MKSLEADLVGFLAGILLAYILGSLPFAIWITRWTTGADIRQTGSGHAGATNVMRAAGWLPATAVLLLDLGKGYLGMRLAMNLISEPLGLGLAAGALVVGHCWPLLAGMRGGMGMAVGGGALLAIWPLGFVLGVGLAAAMQLVVRHSARGNLLGALLLTPMWWVAGATPFALAIAAGAGVVVAVRATSDWNREYHELWLDRQESSEETGSEPPPPD
jgi:glycerol-3-phosphate acyltransferase PlsY